MWFGVVHSWQNGTRCRDGVKILWCRSHLVWLVFEGSIPTCACLHFANFCDLFLLIFFLRAPCCPEDPLDIPGSSLLVPSDTGPHTVRRIPWTSQDPPLDPPMVSFQTQADYRIFQYYFLVWIKPKNFVVMITKYNNISQESRIYELAFFSVCRSVSIIAAINLIEVCNEHTALIGGRHVW